MSQDLYGILKERAGLGRFNWPVAISISLLAHGVLLAAIVVLPEQAPDQEEPKVTWVTLPAAGAGTSGGSTATEVGETGERIRRVEEVAPKTQTAAKPSLVPNAWDVKGRHTAQGKAENAQSLGKAPEAAKGSKAAERLVTGAAGQGDGSGIGAGTGVPGLKTSFGADGGTGLIGEVDGTFPYTWYLLQVQNKITSNWSRINDAPGRVQIYFRIGKDGRVENVRVEVTSGNAALDQSALLAIKRSDTLPPLPPGYDAPSLGVRFWFSYLGQ